MSPNVAGAGCAPYSGTVWSRQRSTRVGTEAGGERGKNGKKRAVIAMARKLAVLLHRLWVSGEAYEPLRNQREVGLPAAA